MHSRRVTYMTYFRTIVSTNTCANMPGSHTSHFAFCSLAGQTYQERYPFGREIEAKGVTVTEAQRPTEPEKEYQPHPTKKYTTSITVKAPESFAPKPISEEDSSAMKPLPPVVPPKPFKDTRIFENVDTHAVEVGDHHTLL